MSRLSGAMERECTEVIGDWRFYPATGLLRRKSEPRDEVQLNRRLVKVLEVLVGADGEIVSGPQLLALAWKGRVVSADSISTAIYQLRKKLGDNSHSPEYIETVPNEGYRLVAPIGRSTGKSHNFAFYRWASAAAVLVFTATASVFYLSNQTVAKTVYVPPVLNSTGIEANDGVSVMFRSRIMNTMGHNEPDIVATVSDNVASRFTLESELVGCESGPAVIFRLIETESQRHVWSQHYDMRPDAYESDVLDMAVGRVSRTIEDSATGVLVFEPAEKDAVQTDIQL